MKMVLKAKKETPDATPLPCKIKAEAVFEGQEAGAERCLQPEKFIVTHFSLAEGPRTAGAAHVPLEGPLPGETMTSSSPTRETWGGKWRAKPRQVFVEDEGTHQPQIKQCAKKLSIGFMQGQHSPGVCWKEGYHGPAPDWCAWHTAYHWGIPHTESSWLVLNIVIFPHDPKWRKRRRNSDQSNRSHPRNHLSYPCKLSKDASNTPSRGTSQTLVSKQSITAVCSPAVYTPGPCPLPWHVPPSPPPPCRPSTHAGMGRGFRPAFDAH